MKKADIKKVFDIFQKNNPNPICELNYVNEYTFLIAIILSAQATDKGVNKATPALFGKINTPEKMLILGLDGLKEYIKTIGLYNNKAKSIISMSERLINNFNSCVPKNRDDLESLAGVGRKTANVFLNSMYQEPFLAVDTHVSRVSQRLALTKSNKPIQIEKDLEKVIPDSYKAFASHWLVLHGRYVCKAKKPNCKTCEIAKYCHFLKTDKK